MTPPRDRLPAPPPPPHRRRPGTVQAAPTPPGNRHLPPPPTPPGRPVKARLPLPVAPGRAAQPSPTPARRPDRLPPPPPQPGRGYAQRRVIQRMEMKEEEVGPMDISPVLSGVMAKGALSEEQVEEIISWGQKKGKNGDLDELADVIFAMREGEDRKLASSVTGVIAETGLTEINTGLTVVFLAQQSGKTKRDMKRIKSYLAERGYYPVAMDDISGSPLHGEMTLIANMLEKGIPLENLARVGVAGKKGCCRLCSGVLSKLGVGFSHTKQSAWEEQTWMDPWGKVNRKNPYLTKEKRY